MKRNPEITAQTKQNLLDAFWELYCKEKIEKISIREIADKAGYNRSTFYEYFTDVYDVLDQIENSVLPNLKSDAVRKLVQKPDLHLSLSHFIRIYSKNKKYYIVLLGENGDPAFQEKVKMVLKSVIQQHLQISGTDDLTLECTMEYTASAILGVLTYYYKREAKPKAESIIKLLFDLMDHGVMKNLKWKVSIQ